MNVPSVQFRAQRIPPPSRSHHVAAAPRLASPRRHPDQSGSPPAPPAAQRGGTRHPPVPRRRPGDADAHSTLAIVSGPWIVACARRSSAHIGKTSTERPNARGNNAAHGRRRLASRCLPPPCGTRRRFRSCRSVNRAARRRRRNQALWHLTGCCRDRDTSARRRPTTTDASTCQRTCSACPDLPPRAPRPRPGYRGDRQARARTANAPARTPRAIGPLPADPA